MHYVMAGQRLFELTASPYECAPAWREGCVAGRAGLGVHVAGRAGGGAAGQEASQDLLA